MQSAFIDGARAVGYALAATEMPRKGGMGFDPLKLIERREIGVSIVERDDQANGHLGDYERVYVETLRSRWEGEE